MLKEELKTKVRKEFEGLTGNVRLIVFTQEIECEYCQENRRLVEEVTSLSDKITLEVYNFQIDKEKVLEYKVDKIPATVVMSAKDYGIRFYGIASEFEFNSLIEAIKIVSKGESGLSPATKEKLKKINQPMHIQIFVTPTCPYCTSAVIMAHKLAVENDFITADMVEAMEFPVLAHKYNVFAVPKTVINETIQFEGALPEPKFVEEVLKAVS